MAGPKIDKLPALTGLRGVCALWVVLFHLDRGNVLAVSRYGYLGVDVFFILSGFILSHVYTAQVKRLSFSEYRKFLWFRAVRIYPVHLFSLLLLLTITFILPNFEDDYFLKKERFAVDSFIASVLLIQNWAYWMPTAWNAPAWSLSAEWFAYLIFLPLLMILQRVRSPPMALALAAVSLSSFIAALLLKGIHDLNVSGTPGMLRMLCEFAAGCLLYRAYASGLELPFALLTIGAVGLLGISLVVKPLIFASLFGLSVLVLLGTHQRGPISFFLTTRPIIILGEISFSLYMLHWIIYQVSDWILARIELEDSMRPFWSVGLLIFIFLISFASYHGIERPARLFGRNIAAKVQEEPAPMNPLETIRANGSQTAAMMANPRT